MWKQSHLTLTIQRLFAILAFVSVCIFHPFISEYLMARLATCGSLQPYLCGLLFLSWSSWVFCLNSITHHPTINPTSLYKFIPHHSQRKVNSRRRKRVQEVQRYTSSDTAGNDKQFQTEKHYRHDWGGQGENGKHHRWIMMWRMDWSLFQLTGSIPGGVETNSYILSEKTAL